LWKKTVTFTEGEDEGVVNPDELVVGKKSGTGLRMSVIKFDLSDLLELQQDNNIWIYESNIFLTVSPSSEGSNWKPQVTKLHRLAVSWPEVSTNVGQLTSEQNIADSTGQFNELSREPTRDIKMKTDFLDTVHKWISPYNKHKNEKDYGLALVSQYVDESDERTDAMDVRYYGYDNVTDEYMQPWVDVCFKRVDIPECEDDDYDKHPLDVVSSVVLVEGGDANANETLTHGQDNDGKVYRTVLKFDLDEYRNTFKSYDVMESFIHLNYLGPSDEGSPTTRTVTVHKITKDWTEDDITWENLEYKTQPSGTLKIEESRLGGTEVTIPVHDLAREWIEGGEDNFGVVLIDADENSRSSIPQYAHDDSEQYQYKPTLSVCQRRTTTTSTAPPITTTVPTTANIATQTTPLITREPLCAVKTKEPVEKMTVYVVNGTTVVDPDDYDPEDITLCVSDEEIKIKYCEDKGGKCKKMQRRDIYGKVETQCNCCLPVIKPAETKTFNCFGDSVPREIPIRLIQTCKCQQCARDSETGEMNGMEIVEPNETIDKRASSLLLL